MSSCTSAFICISACILPLFSSNSWFFCLLARTHFQNVEMCLCVRCVCSVHMYFCLFTAPNNKQYTQCVFRSAKRFFRKMFHSFMSSPPLSSSSVYPKCETKQREEKNVNFEYFSTRFFDKWVYICICSTSFNLSYNTDPNILFILFFLQIVVCTRVYVCVSVPVLTHTDTHTLLLQRSN